jgi:asparagine synthase (glutamine-hydrolysing)
VDLKLMKSLAPVVARFARGAGKAALARAPSISLPEEVVTRSKTGFVVPTGNWISNACKLAPLAEGIREPKGLVSRRWSQVVLGQLRNPGHLHAL